MGFSSAVGQGVRLDQVALVFQFPGPEIIGQAGKGRGRILLRDFLQPLQVPGRGGLAGGKVPHGFQAMKIGVQEHVPVPVAAVEFQKALIEAKRPERRRILVGRLRPIKDEFVRRAEDGGIGFEDEGVLGGGRGPLARHVEAESLESDEVEHRRPQGLRRIARLEKIAVDRNGRSFQRRLILQDVLVEGVDLPDDPAEIPGREILLVDSAGGRRALGEPPPVPGEIMPVPLGQDGPEHHFHPLRGLVDLLPDPGHPGPGLVALDDRLQDQAAGQGPESLALPLLLEGQPDDLLQVLDGRPGEAVTVGGLDQLP